MSEETIPVEVKSALEEINKEIKASQEKLVGQMEKVSEEKAMDLIKAYKEEAGAYNIELDKKFDEIQKHVDDLDKKAQTQNINSKQSAREKFSHFLKENIVEKALEIGKKGYSTELEFKVVGDMSSANITTAITNEYVPGFLEAGVNRVAKTAPFVQQYINTASVSNTRTVTWYEQTTTEGAPAVRAEGATMAQVDYDWQRKQEALKIISGYTKVTNEALSDLSWLMSEIQFELLRDLEILLDSQLLTGDGTGNNISGIRTKATAFAAGAQAVLVQSPNRFDVLRVAINQIVKANFFPTIIFLNPDDLTFMDLTKATDDQYLMPPFSTASGMVIKGVPIVASNRVTSGDFVVMDGSRATAYFREGLNLRVWDQNENDPLFNRKTITGNVEAMLRIKGNDTPAFVDGTFSTAITALTLP